MQHDREVIQFREGMKKDDPLKGEMLVDRYLTNHADLVPPMLSGQRLTGKIRKDASGVLSTQSVR
jgi:hypothetical protein